eukprot:gene41689-56444_t
MTTVSLKEAQATFSEVVDRAAAGDFVTITRHGRPAAVLVSVSTAEAARKLAANDKPSLVEYLSTFPPVIDLDDEVFARNPAPSRTFEPAYVSEVLLNWRDIQTRANSIYLSAISVHEIEKGAHLLAQKGRERQAAPIR